jgi:hypothetical protein
MTRRSVVSKAVIGILSLVSAQAIAAGDAPAPNGGYYTDSSAHLVPLPCGD